MIRKRWLDKHNTNTISIDFRETLNIYLIGSHTMIQILSCHWPLISRSSASFLLSRQSNCTSISFIWSLPPNIQIESKYARIVKVTNERCLFSIHEKRRSREFRVESHWSEWYCECGWTVCIQDSPSHKAYYRVEWLLPFFTGYFSNSFAVLLEMGKCWYCNKFTITIKRVQNLVVYLPIPYSFGIVYQHSPHITGVTE